MEITPVSWRPENGCAGSLVASSKQTAAAAVAVAASLGLRLGSHVAWSLGSCSDFSSC